MKFKIPKLRIPKARKVPRTPRIKTFKVAKPYFRGTKLVFPKAPRWF